MLIEHKLTIDTTGPAGQAVGSGVIAIPSEARRSCLIEWIAFAFHENAPSTTELSATFERSPLGIPAFRVSNSRSGQGVCPRKQAVDATGNPIVGAAVRLPAGSLEISVAGCDPLAAAVTVTMCVRRR